MPEKLLVVDDEPALQQTLKYALEKEGYLVKVAADGKTAVQLARAWTPDMMLLDVMLPGMDGFEVCKAVRKESDIPILMLTARQDEVDRVVGLEVGADDYIGKPFSMRELIARVRAQLRRMHTIRATQASDNMAGAPAPAGIKMLGDLTIDSSRREVKRAGVALALAPKEYDLLTYFAEHRGQMLTRPKMLEQVWGWDYVGDTRTVDVHVRSLRQKIEKDPSNPVRIVTVRGGGYRFEG